MIPKRGFEPHIAIGDVTVDQRDVEMLRAVDRYGSMQRAADELGRSYPHLQRRIVELEEATGDLTDRIRGGSDGGGTELTAAAERLIRQFERLRVELGGVTSVTESVVPGTVTDREGELATVRTPAGEITARVPAGTDRVEVLIRSDAIVLMAPDAAGEADRTTSLRNRLVGTISEIDDGETIARVTVDLSKEVDVEAVVTRESASRLGLSAGRDVLVAFKTTAARGVAVDD